MRFDIPKKIWYIWYRSSGIHNAQKSKLSPAEDGQEEAILLYIEILGLNKLHHLILFYVRSDIYLDISHELNK